MKELIPMDEYGMLADNQYVARVDSRAVAEVFGKEHKDVLRSIKRITGEDSGFSEEFGQRNFAPSSYKNAQNKNQPCYQISRDGFTALVMGFTGRKADEFKEAYINRFNEMEAHILKIQSLKEQYPMLTDAIRDAHEDPKPYHYSNEADMLNRIAFGRTAKQLREEYGIPKNEPIRPYLLKTEAALLDYLQLVDVGFIYSIPDFQMRKQKLEWCAMKWKESHRELLIAEKEAS